MVWQRARSDEQKNQRRQILLSTASRMFSDQPLETISLNAIAREANVSKANIYRYFESREQVFLQLTLEALEQFAETAERRLSLLEGPASGEEVARIYAESFVDHPRFARLSSVLSTVLEKNVSSEAIVSFKLAYLESLDRLFAATHRALTDLSEEQIGRVIQAAYILMVGMWPAANPVEAVAEALERPELQSMCINFQADYPVLLAATIRGLRQ